ncbi:MAG: carboxypeptidase-like regulatory domain-containing protein [Acidobacteriia bacterium]|nr:carboxypeptidase-like regulatory domain-containing protein [Terriglobia bacterium]
MSLLNKVFQHIAKLVSFSPAAVLLVALLAPPLAHAQSTGGRIRGTVLDASGGSVAAATVILTNEATGAKRDAQSSGTGEYMFLEVPVGSYQVEVQMTGFKKYLRKGIVLQLNEVLSLDITLQVGGSAETVEVTGAPPLVDTTSTQLGAVVNERSVSQLPLAQRDTYQLLSLQPGVQSTLGVDNVFGSDKAGVVSVNGGRGRDNNFTVNGGDGNDQFANLPAVQPSPDAIAEFRMLTNTFDAEYGRNSGAVINVVTKSGTNDWHGNLYDYFRNKNLNAKGFFDSSKLDYLQNQFGATFGGPIKKDKTFFFATYEGDRIRKGSSSDTVTVPTGPERTGDFSGGIPFAGTLSNASILNNRPGCLTALGFGAPIADGTAYSAIFPTNVIPTACMDQTAQDLMTLVPTANRPDGTWQGVPLGHERSNQFTVKMDQELTSKQHLTGYYYFTQHYLAKPFARFQAGGANLPGFGDLTDERTQQLNISHTWQLGSSGVNEARFTFFREGQGTYLHPQHTSLVQNSCPGVVTSDCFIDPSNPNNTNNTSLGVYPGLDATHEGLPFVSISGGFSMGNNFEGELPQKGNTFQFSDSYGKVIGKHSLKFGGDFRIQQFDQRLYFDVNGAFYLYGGGPNDPMYQNLYPNFLLGLSDNYIQGSAQDELVRSKAAYLFAQDSWSITPSLTLNYGVRWELNTPLTDKGKKVQTFHPGQNSTIYPCSIATTNPLYALNGNSSNCDTAGVTPTGVVVPGDAGVPNGLTDTYYKAFAPRIGLAWSPSSKEGFLGKLFGGPGKTSVRAGFGMFYNPIEQLVLEQFSAEPPFGGSTSIYNTMFSLPFQYQDGTSAPNPFNGILNPPRGTPVDWSVFRPMLFYGQWPAKMRPQYAEQYNLTIQREIVKDLVFQISYVGRQGHRLLATRDLNPGNAQTCLDLANIAAANPNDVLSYNGGPQANCAQWSADNSYFVPAGTTIPAGGLHLPYGPTGPTLIPAGTVVGAQGITLVGIRPYSSPNCAPLTGVGCPIDSTPVITSIFSQDTMASSSYNSLQTSLEKRFSHGLQFQASYTFGKSLDYASTFESLVDPYNMARNRSLSIFDARHRFVFSYYWELPIPKYQGFAGKAFNGWSLSGITQFQTGFPIRITSQDDMELQGSFDFEMPGQPNFAAGAVFKATDPRINGYGFDPSTFTNSTVALGTIGNAPRTICCGPSSFNTDLGFQKQIPVNERVRFEFRGDFMNVFNHTQFMQPDGNITDGPDFGRVKRAREPRLVQFALKMYF